MQTLDTQTSNQQALPRRFDRIGRLVGDDAMRAIGRAHVMVVGVGGVGSWAAEALARSGIGTITLVDFDHVCITNFNRQVPAVEGTVGARKADVMAQRLRTINPDIAVHVVPVFYDAAHAADVFALRPDFVVDAIDSVGSKCHLLHHCISHGIPVVSSCGSGGRMDPTMIKIADLAAVQHDRLAQAVRKTLRKQYDFPAAGNGAFGVPAVHSTEQMKMPVPLECDEGKGFRCVCSARIETFNCESRNVILGTMCHVTGAFGFACASVVVRNLLSKGNPEPPIQESQPRLKPHLTAL